jgi:hypothetical protein
MLMKPSRLCASLRWYNDGIISCLLLSGAQVNAPILGWDSSLVVTYGMNKQIAVTISMGTAQQAGV